MVDRTTENQITELRRFTSAQGWDLAGEYIDHDSGGGADRAEFRRMFADAAQRRFELVLVWALDRFTREGVAETFWVYQAAQFPRRSVCEFHRGALPNDRTSRRIDDRNGRVDCQAGAGENLGTCAGGT
jgi:DNA invertase Pin-like site-specific DNA recombinase